MYISQTLRSYCNILKHVFEKENFTSLANDFKLLEIYQQFARNIGEHGEFTSFLGIILKIIYNYFEKLDFVIFQELAYSEICLLSCETQP